MTTLPSPWFVRMLVACAASGLVGCEAASPPSAQLSDKREPVAQSSLRPSYPPPGFTAFERLNDAQLCVFSNYAEQFRAQTAESAGPQRLAAGEPVVFGTYPGACVREGCVEQPSMECTVEREGRNLTVRSRFWGIHRDGGGCAAGKCQPVAAGCASEALEPGKYTVKHGETRFELNIPSALDAPCLDRAPRPPPGG
jgi:hypothetical protein